MNAQIRRLGLVLVALFVALFAQLNYVQVIRGPALANAPGNSRNAVRDFGQARGAIRTADGVVLARSSRNPNRRSKYDYIREYPGGQLYGHITGYFSFAFGSTGVEAKYNSSLAGHKGAFTVKALTDLLKDTTVTADVTTTLNDSLQRVAAKTLGKRRGSIVAMDPRNGRILAMVSWPAYDPTALASIDPKVARAEFDRLNRDPAKPLLARAYREQYPPGSTFKIVTGAAGLETGKATPETDYPLLRFLEFPPTNYRLRNFGGGECGGLLETAFQFSCNTAFAQVGLDVGADRMAEQAGAFGFNQRPPLDLSPGAARSRYPEVSFFKRSPSRIAQAAIGQSEVAATPLEMVLVAAAIANGGVMMEPHVVDIVCDSRGDEVQRVSAATWRRATTPDVATTMTAFMEKVVEAGTGTRAQIEGVRVAAKTGTAQTANGRAHAWTVAFAPADAPRIAVAVIVENQPEVSTTTGGRIAAPIARAVLSAGLALPEPDVSCR